jgi:hypothetical protein
MGHPALVPEPPPLKIKVKGSGQECPLHTFNCKGKGQSDFSDWPFNAGNDLLSHTLSRAVQSALRGSSFVFGMGTEGIPRALAALRSENSSSCLASLARRNDKGLESSPAAHTPRKSLGHRARKIKVKGGGQECPPYTFTGKRKSHAHL